MRLMTGALLALSFCSVAPAGIVQADFQEVLDLPFFNTGPRLEQLNGVALPAASPQLTAANMVSNPSGWNNSLNVSFDPTTNILSLTGDGNNDYQIITVTLSNLLFDIPGQQVIGITPISTGNAAFPDGTEPFIVTPSFTANSFSVSYSTGDFSSFPPDFLIGPGTDTFQVQLGASDAPEPGTMGLMVLGAAGLVAWRRRRTA